MSSFVPETAVLDAINNSSPRQPSGSALISGRDPEPNNEDIANATQAVLSGACKRRKLSSTGTKAALAARLKSAGFKTMEDVRKLSAEYTTNGVDMEASTTVCPKAPNWNKHETLRLCHVINNPANSTILARLYNKPSSRAELDSGRYDPWAHEFADLYNSDTFMPEIPDLRDGVTHDILDQFDPNAHPHKCQGALLKSK